MHPHHPSNDTTAGNDNRKVVVPPARNEPTTHPSDRDAAANHARENLDALYNDSSANQLLPALITPIKSAVESVSSETSGSTNLAAPYNQVHGDEGISLSMGGQSDEWNSYHSAWQNYYQQYYQRYYLQQLNSTRQKLEKTAQEDTPVSTKPRRLDPEDSKKTIYSDNHAHGSKEKKVSINPATTELKDKLLRHVKKRAEVVRKSHHFTPILSAVFVGLLFILLQYNQVIQGQVRAYVSPGSISPQNVIVDPNAVASVGPEPRIIIPKLNVDAPIVYDVGSLQDAPVQRALKNGVVHYPLPGAESRPGQVGNNVILGHSSNDVFDDGDYKFVFTLLERLEVGDTFYINHESKRYSYSVTKKEVIRPSEIGKLIYSTDKPVVSLVTCVPVGTAANRLVVTAEQISPDPSKALAAPNAPTITSQTANLPGNSPTVIERLFGR